MSKEIKQGNKRDVLTKLPKLMIPFIAILLIIVGFSVLHAYKYLNSRYFKLKPAESPIITETSTPPHPSSSGNPSGTQEGKGPQVVTQRAQEDTRTAQDDGGELENKKKTITKPVSDAKKDVKDIAPSVPAQASVSVKLGNILDLSIPPVFH